MTWLLKLRKIPLIGWLVAIIAVLTASLIWSVRAASYRERQLRISTQISSAEKDHLKRVGEIDKDDAIARGKLRAFRAAQLGKLEARAADIRKAEKESSQRLSDMVNAMFKK